MDKDETINQELDKNAFEDYFKFLDDFELTLTDKEAKDIEELNELQKSIDGADVNLNIWETIKNASFDAIEHIIGLDDRGDCRPDEGAIVTTPHNFRKGITATDADKKRFEMWQDRVNNKYENASEFRERVIDPDFNKKRGTYKSSIRNSDGSYNNAYKKGLIYDRDNPKAYFYPDASGDMHLDNSKAIDIDHVYSVGSQYVDDLTALYCGSDKERFESDVRDILNSKDNFAPTDATTNRTRGEQELSKFAEDHPEFGLDKDKIEEAKNKARHNKNKQLIKNSLGEKTKDFAVGIGKSTLAATGKVLIGKGVKIAVSETVIEFSKNKEKKGEKLIDRLKRLWQRIMDRVKQELSHIWDTIKQSVAANAISEIVNLIINYFVSTVKNIFKLIRCMFGSIINAFKIIFDKSKPWDERVFEALKIISGGLAMASGALLNELLDKLISTNIPFLAPLSGDISAIISGIVSSILSALVLMAFDKYKASINFNNAKCKMDLVQMRLTGYGLAHTAADTLRTELIVAQTQAIVKQEIMYMALNSQEIQEALDSMRDALSNIDKLGSAIDKTLDQQKVSSAERKEKIDVKLNNLINECPYE